MAPCRHGREIVCSQAGSSRSPSQVRVTAPIAGAPVLAKLAINMCMLAHDKAIAQVFQEHGLQFGIGRPDGCLTAVRHTQLLLEANPKHIVIRLDQAPATDGSGWRARWADHL